MRRFLRMAKGVEAAYPTSYFTSAGARSRATSEGLMDVENEDLTAAGLAAKMAEWQESEGGVDAYVYDDAARRMRQMGGRMPSGIKRASDGRASARMARIERIAARVVEAWGPPMPREFYLPKGERAVNLQKTEPAGSDVVAYTYEDATGKLYALAFAGKGSKPLWHYRFRSVADRQRRIDETVADRKSRAESTEQRRQERVNYRHGLKVGDILYSSWGYDQTNVSWYQVVQVQEKMAQIREIAGKMVGEDHVEPDVGRFTGMAMWKRVGVGDSVRIESYASASKWDGRPVYETPFGMGH
jgi:hypothetical protein